MIFCTFRVKTIKLRRYDFFVSGTAYLAPPSVLPSVVVVSRSRQQVVLEKEAAQVQVDRTLHAGNRRRTTVRTAVHGRLRTVRRVRVGHAVHAVHPVRKANVINEIVFELKVIETFYEHSTIYKNNKQTKSTDNFF